MADTIADQINKLRTLLESFDELSKLSNVLDVTSDAHYTFSGDITLSEILNNGFGATLTNINDDTTTSITRSYVYLNCTALQNVNMSALTKITGALIFKGCSSLLTIDMPLLSSIENTYTFLGCTALLTINMPNITTIAGADMFQYCSSLLHFKLEKNVNFTSIYYMFLGCSNLTDVDFGYSTYSTGDATLMFNNCYNLKYVNMPYFNFSNPNQTFSECSNLIDLIIGENLNKSLNLTSWSPTNALSSTSTSLIDEGESFTSNLEKLLYNIREHIATNLPDLTGSTALTLTMSSAVKAAINADEATLQAFTDKNWTIA